MSDKTTASARTTTQSLVAEMKLCAEARPRWQIFSALALGLVISLALYWNAILEPDLTPWITWAVLALSLALTASIVFHLVANRRRVKQICTLVETLAEEIRERRESEERYRRLIDHAPDAIITLDTEARFTSSNPHCTTLTGWSPTEWLGKPFWPLIHAEDLPEVRAAFTTVLQGEKPATLEIRALHKTGNFIPMEFMVTPQFQNNRVNGIIAVGRDITARRHSEHTQTALELQLRRAQKMEAIGRLAGGIAHEFNNFLTVIMGSAELVRMELGASHPCHENLEHIGKASRRAAELVRQILTFSHRRDQDERRVLKLEPVVKDAVKMLGSTLPANIEIRTQFAPDCPLVMADPGEIHQVIINLATNSAHAMREKAGVLEISMASLQVDEEFASRNLDLHVGRYVQLTVCDNGHGMSAATLESIFEPFFTTKSPGEGTGLGLPVVHGIVKGFGGAISVYSEPERGTSFHVFLPAAQGEEEKFTNSGAMILQGSGQRILLVDDEVSLAEGGLRILNRIGYQATIRSCPVAALELFRVMPQAFDCIITDHSMPRMSGIELATECRRLNARVPIILMSGYSGQWTTESLRPHGICDLLMKPFTPQFLAQTLHHIFHPKPSDHG